MRPSIVVAALLFAAAAARADAPKPPPPSSDDAKVVSLPEAKFVPNAPPGMPAPGAEGSLIGVDPKSGGPTGYARFAPGFHVPAHWHAHTEWTLLISGKATFVLDGKSYRIEPGAYFIVPPKTTHELTCDAAAPCVLLTRRAGPADFNVVAK